MRLFIWYSHLIYGQRSEKLIPTYYSALDMQTAKLNHLWNKKLPIFQDFSGELLLCSTRASSTRCNRRPTYSTSVTTCRVSYGDPGLHWYKKKRKNRLCQFLRSFISLMSVDGPLYLANSNANLHNIPLGLFGLAMTRFSTASISAVRRLLTVSASASISRPTQLS